MPKTGIRRRKFARRVRKSFKSRTPSVRALARQVRSLSKNTEIKHGETSSAGQVPTNDPNQLLWPLRSVGQGVGDYNSRIGDKMQLLSTGIRMTVRCDAGANPQTMRVICFQYLRNPDAAITPASTIINLYLVSTYMNTSNAVNAPRDWDNKKSFKTLYDKKRVIHKANSVTSDTVAWDVFVKIPPAQQEIRYIAAGTIPVQNEVFWLIISEQDTGLNYDYITNIYYKDA